MIVNGLSTTHFLQPIILLNDNNLHFIWTKRKVIFFLICRKKAHLDINMNKSSFFLNAMTWRDIWPLMISLVCLHTFYFSFFLPFFVIVLAAKEVAPFRLEKLHTNTVAFRIIYSSNQQNIRFFWDLDYAWHRQFLFVCLVCLPLNIMPHSWWAKIFSFLIFLISCVT